MNKKLVIAVDGPAGSGKSTVCRILSKRIFYTYLDTGALYRVVAYKVAAQGISHTDEAALVRLCATLRINLRAVNGELKVYADDEDVTDRIRTEEMGLLASTVSAVPAVRTALLGIQRKMGETGGVIAEGRDMATVVFPGADLKFFLDADADARARRRYRELVERGERVDFEEIKKSVIERDRQDVARDVAPLRVSDDAIVIDTTYLSIAEVVETMVGHIEKAASGSIKASN